MSSYHRAFNLIWKVNNINLDELIKTESTNKYDVIIEENQNLSLDNIPEKNNDTFFFRIKKNTVTLLIRGIAILEISNGNKILFKKETPNVGNQDISTFILSSGIGAILIQRDVLLLHANAMEKNNESIICLGASGSGKSTLAFSLMQKGWKLISDDQVALTQKGFVVPGIPRVKLWKESMDEFKISESNYPRVRKGINKFTLSGSMIKSKKYPCKLKSIYILKVNKSEVNDNYSGIKEIKNEKEKFINLRDNLFRPRFVRGLGKESQTFLILSKLIKNFKVFELVVPNGIVKMNIFLESIQL